MKKIVCPKCSSEIGVESSANSFVCGNCSANLQFPPNAKKISMSETPVPKMKSQLLTILVTSLLTALFLMIFFMVGIYWFLIRTVEKTSITEPIKSPETRGIKPTPRVKKSSSISASEIIKIQFSESRLTTQTSPVQYFGNVNSNNFLSVSNVVSFSSDGAALKTSSRISTLNGVQSPEKIERYFGSISSEKFLELAQILVENDFLGEEDSKASTSLPLNYTFSVIYSSGEKEFKTSNSGDDTPEADAMLKAFKRLDNLVDWKKL